MLSAIGIECVDVLGFEVDTDRMGGVHSAEQTDLFHALGHITCETGYAGTEDQVHLFVLGVFHHFEEGFSSLNGRTRKAVIAVYFLKIPIRGGFDLFTVVSGLVLDGGNLLDTLGADTGIDGYSLVSLVIILGLGKRRNEDSLVRSCATDSVSDGIFFGFSLCLPFFPCSQFSLRLGRSNRL